MLCPLQHSDPVSETPPKRFGVIYLSAIIRFAPQHKDMPQTNYQTVFHIGLNSFPWFFMLPFVLLIAIGYALIRFSDGKQIRFAVGYLMIIWCSLLIVLANLNLIPKFVEARHAYLNGDSSVIEGTVESFHPMPTLGVADESFSVNGKAFLYNVLDPTPCFHNSPPHGGPIHSGLSVRIYYKDQCIQRVDVHR
jgi:hypothetical protein